MEPSFPSNTSLTFHLNSYKGRPHNYLDQAYTKFIHVNFFLTSLNDLMQVTKNSASYWEGKSDAESLQRVYGISFPDPKMLKEWKHFQEEAAKRDHRKIGRCRWGEVASW